MTTYLLVFCAMFALDFTWAFYTRSIQRHHIYSAAAFSAMIVMLNGLLAITVVSDNIAIIPAVAGAFAGTIVALKIYGAKGATHDSDQQLHPEGDREHGQLLAGDRD